MPGGRIQTARSVTTSFLSWGKKISEIIIDADKDWNAKKITNLGAPVDPNDAARLADTDFWQELSRKEVHFWDDFTNWAEFNDGGTIYRELTRGHCRTINTGEATAVIYLWPYTMGETSLAIKGINFDKEIDITWFTKIGQVGSGSDRWQWLRVAPTYTGAHLSDKGFGLAFQGGIVDAESWHSGLRSTECGYLGPTLVERWQIRHRPDGEAVTKFYKDGVLKATHDTQVPSGVAGTAKISFGAWSDGSSQAITIDVLRIAFKSDMMG